MKRVGREGRVGTVLELVEVAPPSRFIMHAVETTVQGFIYAKRLRVHAHTAIVTYIIHTMWPFGTGYWMRQNYCNLLSLAGALCGVHYCNPPSNTHNPR